MIIKIANLPSIVKLCTLVATVFTLSQCSQEDEIVKPVASKEATANVSTTNESDVPFSLNISGIHTFSPSKVECKTCKYTVAANISVIDGEKLGIKPGDIICLDAALKYGSLEFINLNGTIEKPVIIANCDSRLN